MKLKVNKGNLIKYSEIVKTLSNTWADIRNQDSDFGEVKMLWHKKEGDNTQVDKEEGLI